MPLDVAINLPADERMAWVVICGRFEGSDFDWIEGRWKERG